MPTPTMSALPLAMACPLSYALPHSPGHHSAGDDGHDRHELLRKALSSPRGAEGVEVDDPTHRNWLDEVFPLASSVLQGMADEVAFAYVASAPPRGHLLGARLGRNYPATVPGVDLEDRYRPTVFFGTADYYYPNREDGVVHVVDLKTGQMDAPHPRRNWQLRALAAAAALWEGLPAARVGLLRAPEGRGAWWQWHDLDAFELAEAQQGLEQLDADIAKARRVLADRPEAAVVLAREGDHCRFCPARLHCPAQTHLARRLGAEPQAVVSEMLQSLTPEMAGEVLQRLRAAKDVLRQVEAALYAHATEAGGITLPDGRVWRKVDKVKRELVGQKVHAVLSSLHGSDVAARAVQMESTRAAVERALATVYEARKKAGEKVTKKALLEEVMTHLRGVGGVAEVLSSAWEDVDGESNNKAPPQ